MSEIVERLARKVDAQLRDALAPGDLIWTRPGGPSVLALNIARTVIETPPRSTDPWRPIETAPQDGSAVLVMRDIWPGTSTGRAEQCNGHNTYVAEWWAEEEGGAWVCYMDRVEEPRCPIKPTHWMPLPKPPEAQPAPT